MVVLVLRSLVVIETSKKGRSQRDSADRTGSQKPHLDIFQKRRIAMGWVISYDPNCASSIHVRLWWLHVPNEPIHRHLIVSWNRGIPSETIKGTTKHTKRFNRTTKPRNYMNEKHLSSLVFFFKGKHPSIWCLSLLPLGWTPLVPAHSSRTPASAPLWARNPQLPKAPQARMSGCGTGTAHPECSKDKESPDPVSKRKCPEPLT